jgi:hypothetical protein
VSDKLKNEKQIINTGATTSIAPDGAVRLGTKPGSLHARVAYKEANPQLSVPGAPAFKNPFTNFQKIMFFADTSGSMASPDYGDISNYSCKPQNNLSKIELLRRAFDGYLDNCAPAYNAVGIATFPEQAYEPPLANYAELRDIVRQLQASGGTPLAAAMNYVCENEPITHAVIISDGDADEQNLSVELAKRFAAKLVKIDTVHIGSSQGGEQLLKEIAEITGGIYVKFTDVTQFAKTFQYLSPAKRALLTSSKNPIALLGAADVKL